ncbi:MAG: sulfatase-like hydrolase/transferase [Bacteroidetes bacterium]|nr:sulfatase-like hydrolase/transferase [Bacteroidota bacterium]
MNIKKLLFYYLIISLLTILVLFPDLVFFVKNDVVNYAISGFLIVQVLLFIPVFFFSRFLKVYYWILAILVSFTPIMLISVFYMNIQVNAEMMGLVMDTNIEEVKELLGWKIVLVILAMIFCAWLFLKLASRLPSKIGWKHGLIISLIGVFSFGLLPFIRTRKLKYYYTVIRNTYRTYYPFRLGTTFDLIESQLGNMKKYKEVTKNFTFNAVKTDSADTGRHIYILVVGEASRYDHWAINGYPRPTSPEVEKLNNFFTFHDVSSGGTMTILSVPQLITRADPSDYDRHTKEKSILAAFKEAGFYTAWISNQSHYGLTGNIGMHFNDGDTAMYSGHGENETNFTGNYDETILPMVQSVIDNHPTKDIFLIVHLIGSHWRYVLRYPPAFQKFAPTSDRNHTLITRPSKNEIINEYDNSILYTDYILSRLTGILKQTNAVSSFLFVSDHGENLDDNNDGMYFHSYQPTLATAHVPLFLWFSDSYAQKYPDILSNLKANENQKASSAEDVFYTLINVGRLSITGFDSSRNLAGKQFVPSAQKVLGDEGKLYNFKDLR